MVKKDNRIDDVKIVAGQYLNVDKIEEIVEINSGHINSTYLIKMPESSYIIQQINTYVFHSPFGIMHNIKEITKHIRKKVIFEGKDPNRCVLNVVTSINDQNLVIVNNQYWRCFQYIPNATTFEYSNSKEIFYEVGKAVGEFQMLLNDFNTSILDDTIPHFHDTPYRFQHFLDSVKLDKFNRAVDVDEEIEYLKIRNNIMGIIVDDLENRRIPLRVTHNDTKLSNVMIDDYSKKALCLIDLDTVMNGSMLYDYGDAIRIGASTAKEDEKDLNKISLDLQLFKAFTEGFLLKVKEIITRREVEYLYYGCLIITLEIGMRFIDDYLSGDAYFKISYSTHNLDRGRAQLKLAKDIESKKEDIVEIINQLLDKLEFGYNIKGEVYE